MYSNFDWLTGFGKYFVQNPEWSGGGRQVEQEQEGRMSESLKYPRHLPS